MSVANSIKRLVRRFSREDTGARDIRGRPIHEGDEVWLYAQEYDKTLENPDDVETGGVPIYLVDESKPHPVADVPLARGIVEWDSQLMAYMIRYTWQCPQWSDGAAGCHMGGGSYAYEISPNAGVDR